MSVDGRPVDDWRKQAFDFAADSAKQLITVATGVVTATILFAKELDSVTRGWALASWIAFLLSIGCGIAALFNMSGNLHNSAEGKYRNPDLDSHGINFFSLWQIWFFVAGVILVIVFGFFAVRTHPPSDSKPVTVTCTAPPVVAQPPPACPKPPRPCKRRAHKVHSCNQS
jgi:uncharacterized membrane protein